MNRPADDAEQQFPLLDAYVSALQRGDVNACRQLLAAHAELRPLVECLDALDSIVSGIDVAPPSAEAAAAATPHETFGQYELLEEIGRGGMGVVYRARQRGLNRLVAVKLILTGHLASPEHVRRFQLESRAAAAVRHPNIVGVLEAGELHGQHFFAMDFVPGQNLAERLKRGPFDAESAARLVAAVARAVDHLHQQGIVHRDLKPSNILLDETGKPLVNDFGLAKVFSDDGQSTRSGVIAGTPSYMAPEQAAARPADTGPWSDVYSLGAILYELLAGRPPFRADNPLDTLVQVLESEPTPPRHIQPAAPRELEWICLRCLEKSPTARYNTAAQLADDLERFLRHEPVQARDPQGWRRAWRWMRREPALASHWGAMACFYGIELANYHWLKVVDWPFHATMSVVLGAWALASFIFQRWLTRRDGGISAALAWCTLDVAAVTAVLFTADGAASPLVVAYPLLVVGSGLWFRVRLVWSMTALAMLSYGLLAVDFFTRRNDLRSSFDSGYDRPVMFLLMLLVLGIAVAYQVHRVRILQRYFERRAG